MAPKQKGAEALSDSCNSDGEGTTSTSSDSEAEASNREREAQGFTIFSDHGVVHGQRSHDGSEHVTDEVFNAASHLMAGMLSVLGTAVLITGASAHGNPWAIVAFSLYGSSLIFLFFASFLHHAIKGSPKLMSVLRRMDYVAIFFLIPGTMTPVCFVCLTNTWIGWVFFGAIWGLALLGVIMMTLCPIEMPMWASMTMYVTLGWFGGFLAFPAAKCVGMGGLTLMLLGGLSYTGGGVIFTLQKPNPIPGRFGFHEIWHIFVMLGAAFHWTMVFFYVWPAMCDDACST
mmetsp:Transcript_46860/g.145044  ORF Transcript_46860/g.145044 Transcript_46860/m.145044 type:complete len:287 (-) Transcript_46860:85-945(-)